MSAPQNIVELCAAEFSAGKDSRQPEIDSLHAELAEWQKLRDPGTLHVNLLRGMPAQLHRMTFLHLAGATEYDALKARIAELEQDAAAQPKWLPIETAPKDTEVLVGPTKNMGICVAMNDSRDGWVTETQTEWASIYTPTHYMPLPAPPEQKE